MSILKHDPNEKLYNKCRHCDWPNACDVLSGSLCQKIKLQQIKGLLHVLTYRTPFVSKEA